MLTPYQARCACPACCTNLTITTRDPQLIEPVTCPHCRHAFNLKLSLSRLIEYDREVARARMALMTGSACPQPNTFCVPLR